MKKATERRRRRRATDKNGATIPELDRRLTLVEVQLAALMGVADKVDTLLTYIDGLTKTVLRVSEQAVVLDQHLTKIQEDMDARLDDLSATIIATIATGTDTDKGDM